MVQLIQFPPISDYDGRALNVETLNYFSGGVEIVSVIY